MKKKVALVLLAAAALSGCSSGEVADVGIGEVERSTVAETVEAPGTVVARASAAVASPAAGTVAALAVKDGATVAAGDVLLRLSSPAAQQALADALAAQAATRGGDPTAAALAGAQAQSARATVDALTVRAPLAGVVSFGGSAAGAGAGLDGLLGSVPGALQGAAAGLLGGGGPAAPTTTTNDLSVGVPVGEGTPLLTVTDISALGLTASVDETDVLLVEPGTRARIELDAVPGTDFTGQVAGIDLQPTASTGGGVGYRIRLSLVVPAGAPQPRPGMSAVVELAVREATDVLSVPSSAVVRDGADDVVFRVVDGRAVRTPVTLGAEGADRVEVTDGVAEGATIVTADADTLSDGDRVE